MSSLTLESICSKPNKEVPSYLDVVFDTSKGSFKIGYGRFEPDLQNDLSEYQKDELVKLKTEYGPLTIDDARVDYDNSMLFLISNKFIIVLGYIPNTYSKVSNQLFWTIEDIHGSNESELNNFRKMNKVDLPT